MEFEAVQLRASDHSALEFALILVRESFAYMNQRVSPPSSIERLTLEGMQLMAQQGEVWVLYALDGRPQGIDSVQSTSVSLREVQLGHGSLESSVPRPVACVCLQPMPSAKLLYLGRLAVAPSFRGFKLGRWLLCHAAVRARQLDLSCVELKTRVELVENHAIFRKLGFVQVATGRHEGFSRPTYIVMHRYLL